MKRFLYGGLAALGLALSASPVRADCAFEYSCSRHMSFVHTSKSRCFSFSSCANPLPCLGGGCSSAPAMWNGLSAYGAYGYPAAAYPASVAAAAAPAATPAATQPSFQAPPPKSSGSSSTQQIGYFYYGQQSNAGYGAAPSYNYYGGYSATPGYAYYGYGYAGAPNYWY